MTTALTTTTDQPFAFTPKSIADAQSLATELAKSILVPKDLKGKPADVFAAITYGAELGLAPWAAMQSLIVIHGRVTMYADAMVALVLSSGVCEYFRCTENTAQSVTYETLRKGSTPASYTFTAEDAKRAKLTNENYEKFPQRMLGHRAKSFLARDVYPDVLRGLTSYEEIVDLPPGDYVETKQFEAPPVAEVAELPEAEAEVPNQVALAKMITDTSTLAELEALAPEFAHVKKGTPERDELAALYDAHFKTLKAAAK